MRIALIFIFLFPILVFAQVNQTDANGLRQGPWQKKYPNGKLMYEGSFKDGKPIGEWKRFHEGGLLKVIIQYYAGSDSASAQMFDEAGKKVAEGKYFDEKKTGKWTYYKDTKKISEENFLNGEKNGKARKYYDTGELWEETDWINGKQEGSYQVFFKSGKPFLQIKMRDNQRNGLCISYFQNGRVELEAYYRFGLRHGNWKYYDESGKLLYTFIYENNIIMNPQVRDSIENLKILNLEKGKESLVDPEKYMEDPAEYMRKANIY